MIKKDIFSVENYLLKQLCFDFEVQLPYPYILMWGIGWNVERKEILNACRIANEVYFGPECLFYSGEVIAAASLKKIQPHLDLSKLPKRLLDLQDEIEALTIKL